MEESAASDTSTCRHRVNEQSESGRRNETADCGRPALTLADLLMSHCEGSDLSQTAANM